MKRKRESGSNSAKPLDIQRWDICLGPVGERTKVFEVCFSEQNLRKAARHIYERGYAVSRDGKGFLEKAIPDAYQTLKLKRLDGLDAAMVRNSFLKVHSEAVIERILYRLQEKVINRLLSIITEGQAAAERRYEIRRKLSEQDIKDLLDDIYFNNYELTRDVLAIRTGRRRGSLNKAKPQAELDSIRAGREK